MQVNLNLKQEQTLVTCDGSDRRFSEWFNKLCSDWIVYVPRATGEKLDA